MKTVKVKDPKDMKDFIQVIYKDDPHFKDNKTDLLDIVCKSKSPFYSQSLQQMIQIKEGEKVLCQGVLICHKELKDTIAIGFFEALPQVPKAVDKLLQRAASWGRLLGGKKIIIGMEGHCNNSLGILSSGLGAVSFGEVYNPSYYQEYFQGMKESKLISFQGSLEEAKTQLEADMKKLGKYRKDITIQGADFGFGFKETMRRYTDLNNCLFSNHDFYFPRSYEEDNQLFRAMGPLLSGHNLLFAQKNGKDIGFILWYPDFNELVETGKGANWETALKYRMISKKKIKTIKIVEIGVNKTAAARAVLLMLFYEVLQKVSQVHPKVTKVISSWILEENTPSKNSAQRYIKELYKGYSVYETGI